MKKQPLINMARGGLHRRGRPAGRLRKLPIHGAGCLQELRQIRPGTRWTTWSWARIVRPRPGPPNMGRWMAVAVNLLRDLGLRLSSASVHTGKGLAFPTGCGEPAFTVFRAFWAVENIQCSARRSAAIAISGPAALPRAVLVPPEVAVQRGQADAHLAGHGFFVFRTAKP